ncbi:DUF445 domain-containing protein [Fodinicola feengrottensis]|uniref:DUF445 domain-containing protein n=1 Tax=Fodinicola feengrottensis TaxID=435914 RepID=UPI0024430005|nr:hypothetical protein [Fodinicola feengrottensis]
MAILASLLPLVHTSGWVQYLTVPLFTGVIGYVTNWSGVWMLFYPITFKGLRIPGLGLLAPFLPRRLQQVPLGLRQGKFGWQGIIPSRAAKMGSIAIDKGLSKLGSQSEFYQQLDPNAIAEHILATARQEIRAVVDRIMARTYPAVWANVPQSVRETIHDRVQTQLPLIVHQVTDGIGENIDQLLDVKLMVIKHMEADPTLANKIFQEVGKKELRMIINFGFVFGFLLGIPLLFLTFVVPQWWVVPVAGIIIGYLTNWLALYVIFEPVNPVRIGPLRLQGLFIRRQHDVSAIYGSIIADDIITLQNIGDELFDGERGDRTSKMIENYLRPAVDRAVGMAKLPVKVAMGGAQLRADHPVHGGRSDRFHQGPAAGRGVQPAAERQHPQPDHQPHAGDEPSRLRRNPAVGDPRGRMAADPARCGAGARRRAAAHRHFRSLTDDRKRRPGEPGVRADDRYGASRGARPRQVRRKRGLADEPVGGQGRRTRRHDRPARRDLWSTTQ